MRQLPAGLNRQLIVLIDKVTNLIRRRNTMHNQEKDEHIAPGQRETLGRSPCYQTIAKLAETTKNYLAQPGVELRSPNTSSDLHAGCQDPDKKALQTVPEMQEIPPDSNHEIGREFQASTVAPMGQPSQGDREEERVVSALIQSQPKQDSDSFQTAPGCENGAGQSEIKTQQILTTTIQSSLSQIDVAPKNIVTAAFIAGAPISDAVSSTPGSQASGAEQSAGEARTFSQPNALENSEKDVESDVRSNYDESAISGQLQAKQDSIELIDETNQIQRDQKADQDDGVLAEESAAKLVEAEPQHSGRAVRSCVKNTPNYSHTHKGITSTQLGKNVTPFEATDKEQQLVKIEGQEPDAAFAIQQPLTKEERKATAADNKSKLAGKRSYEEICRSYENMFAFDWDLRDINNMRHPPDREVTPIVLWFYINILYFPYNAHELAEVPFEEWAAPIFEQLQRDQTIGSVEGLARLTAPVKCSSNNDKECPVGALAGEVALNDDVAAFNPEESQMEDVVKQHEELSLYQHQQSSVGAATDFTDLPKLIQKLQIESHFYEFKDLIKERMREIKERLGLNVEEQKDEGEEDQEMQDEEEDGALDHLLPENKEERDDHLFEMLIDRLEDVLKDVSSSNKDELARQYARFTKAYKGTESQATLIIEGQQSQVPRPNFPYNPTKLNEYGLDFLSYVDPYFVADIKENQEWYMQNQNEVLLNVSYPSKQEKEFLRHIEQWQQEKNDLNYKRILQQLAEGADDPNSAGPNGLNIQRYNSLSAHKRGLVVQEDAQCAICNNGDYEDEDLIVFCGACNIPVHQRCYGIDEIPDNDWICNNCWAFNMRRGIMVKCILCPKRGGAMKPTSIFRTYEQFMRYHQAALKKKGLHHLNYFTNPSQQPQSSQNSNVAIVAADQAEIQQQQTQNYSQATDQLQEQPAQQIAQESLSLQIAKQSSSTRNQRLHFFEREDKNHALSQILNREGNYQEHLSTQTRENGENFDQNAVELHFLESESIAEIPEDYTFFLQRNEQRLESPQAIYTDTLYEWVHLSCAMWIPGPTVTPKTPVRMSKIDIKRFDLQCIICGKRNQGACIQCQHARCMISFHIECARRSNYFLEVERVDRERNYRVFCEKHRPLKIVREMEEKDKQTLEEVQKFSKLIDRCMETYARAEIKQNRQKRIQPFSKPPVPQQPSKREILAEQRLQKLDIAKKKKQERDNEIFAKKEHQRIKKEQEKKERDMHRKVKQEAAQVEALKRAETSQVKSKERDHHQPSKVSSIKQQLAHQQPQLPTVYKWRDKDKKILFERVRERFLQLMKLRVNVLRVDPMIKIKKRQEIMAKKNEKEQRRIEKKRREKQNKKLAFQQAKKMSFVGQRSGLRSRIPNGANPNEIMSPEPDLTGNVGAEMSSPVLQATMMNEAGAILTMQQENPESAMRQNSEQGDFSHQDTINNVDKEESEGLERRPTIEELIMPEQVEPYFKFATPMHVQELDWAITFSKYDFPWHDVKFDHFTARECYKKYTKEVRDAQTFFKRILGGKEKYKKNIAGQIEDSPQIFFTSVAPPDPVKALAKAFVEKEKIVDDPQHESEDIEHFCKCKGEFNSLTGYFVMCENDTACPNGGWLHPECTRDLCMMSQEEIGKIDRWYCEDCTDFIKTNFSVKDGRNIKNQLIKRKKSSSKIEQQKRQKKKSGSANCSKKRAKLSVPALQQQPQQPQQLQRQPQVQQSSQPSIQQQPHLSQQLPQHQQQQQPQQQHPLLPKIDRQPMSIFSHQKPQSQPIHHQNQPQPQQQTQGQSQQAQQLQQNLPLHLQIPSKSLLHHAAAYGLSSPQQAVVLEHSQTPPPHPKPSSAFMQNQQVSQQQQAPQMPTPTLPLPSMLVAQNLQQQNPLHTQLQFHQSQQQQHQTQHQKASLVSLLQRPKETIQQAPQQVQSQTTTTLSQKLANLAHDLQQRSQQQLQQQQQQQLPTQLPTISSLGVPHQLTRQQPNLQSPATQFILSPRLRPNLQQAPQVLPSQLPLLLSQSSVQQQVSNQSQQQPQQQQQQQLQSSSKVILNFGSKLGGLPKFNPNGKQ